MTTALHLLPEDKYPFSIAAYYRDEDGLQIAWAVTLLGPRGANPMELGSIYVPPLKDWTGHEMEMATMRPREFFAVLKELMEGEQ